MSTMDNVGDLVMLSVRLSLLVTVIGLAATGWACTRAARVLTRGIRRVV